MNTHLISMLTTRTVAIFVAAVAMGTTIPFAGAGPLNALLLGQDGKTLELHKATTKDRLDFKRALEIYGIMLQKGHEGLLKPIFGNRESIELYLNSGINERIEPEVVKDPLSTTDYVKKPTDEVGVDALTVAERAALSQAAKVGKCWHYPNFSSNFDVLCQAHIKGRKTIRTTGLETDLKASRSKSRIQLRGAAVETPKRNLFDELKDNRSGGRVSPYGKNGGRTDDKPLVPSF